MVVEIDASDVGYDGVLKQRLHDKEQLVMFHSGLWLGPQQNYSTIKKEILSIVLCISKFQDDLFTKNSSYELIANQQKRFFKNMLKI